MQINNSESRELRGCDSIVTSLHIADSISLALCIRRQLPVLPIAERLVLGLLAGTEILRLRGRSRMGQRGKACALVASIAEWLRYIIGSQSCQVEAYFIGSDLILGTAAGAPVVGFPSFHFDWNLV